MEVMRDRTYSCQVQTHRHVFGNGEEAVEDVWLVQDEASEGGGGENQTSSSNERDGIQKQGWPVSPGNSRRTTNENPIMDFDLPESRIPRWHMSHGSDGKPGSEVLRLPQPPTHLR